MSAQPLQSAPSPTTGPLCEEPSAFRPALVVAVAGIAALFKVGLALTTFGTNDVVAFYQFAKAIETHGFTWTYQHSVLFNYPPLVGYSLAALGWLDHQPIFQQHGLTFPFFLRLPGIVADFAVVLLVLSIVRKYPDLRPPRWGLILFAISPVSIMVTGFHGNTDPILVLFLLLAAIMAVRSRPALCGLFLALSCQVKVIPLLLLPVFFFFWLEHRRTWSFVGPFVLSSFLFCVEPFLKSPLVFVKNVLVYGSFGFLVAGSSVFLFALYTITSGGFPWYFAHASNKLSAVCAHWAVIPWLTLVGGLIGFVWKARRQDPTLRFLSFKAIEPAITSE